MIVVDLAILTFQAGKAQRALFPLLSRPSEFYPIQIISPLAHSSPLHFPLLPHNFKSYNLGSNISKLLPEHFGQLR